MIVEELVGALGLDVDETGFTHAHQLFGTLKSGLLGIGAAAAGYLGGFVAFTKQSAASLHAAKLQADSLGISTEKLLLLRGSLSEGQAGNEAIASGLRTIATQAIAAITDVGDGSKEAAKHFQFFGISLKTSEGQLKSFDELLVEFGTRFAEVPDSVEKTARATALLGESGAKYLTSFFKQGPEAIQQAMQGAVRDGVALTTEQVNQLEAVHQQFDGIGRSIAGFFNQLAADAAPAVSEIIKDTREWINANRDLGKTIVAGPLKSFAETLPWIRKNWEYIRIAMLATGAIYTQRLLSETKMLGFLQTRLTLTGAIQALEKGMSRESLAAIGKWATGITGAIVKFGVFYLLLDELITYMQGGETAFGGLGKAFEDLGVQLQDDHPLLAGMSGFLGQLLNVNEALDTSLKHWTDWPKRIDDVYESLKRVAGILTFNQSNILGDVIERIRGPQLPELPQLPTKNYLSPADKELLVGGSGTRNVNVSAPATFNVSVAPGMSPRSVARDMLDEYNQSLQSVWENAAAGVP